MKNRVLLTIFLALMTSVGVAQSTSVSATIQDSQSVPWINANYTVNFVGSQPGSPYITTTGSSFTTSFTGTTNSLGQLSVTLADVNFVSPANSTWRFCVIPSVSDPIQTCVNIPVTGASENVSSIINAAIVPPVVGGGGLQTGYADSEAPSKPGSMYFRVTDNTFRCYSTSWAQCLGGGGGSGNVNPAPQFQISYYSAVGTQNILSGDSGATTDGAGNWNLTSLGIGSGSNPSMFNLTDITVAALQSLTGMSIGDHYEVSDPTSVTTCSTGGGTPWLYTHVCIWNGTAWVAPWSTASGGGSGTVNSGAQYSIGFYAATGTTITALSPPTTNATYVLSESPSGGSAVAPAWTNLATYLANPPTIGGTTPGAATFSSLVDSGITTTPSTSPICPNGAGGSFTTTGCATGSSGPINSAGLGYMISDGQFSLFGLNLSGSTGTQTAGRIYACQFPLTSAVSLGKAQIYVVTTGASSFQNIGIYDSVGNLVIDSGAIPTSVAGAASHTFTETVVNRGVYYIAWTNNLSTVAVSGLNPSVSGAQFMISPTVKCGYGSNVLTGSGTTSQALPSTLGTITSYTVSSTNTIPFVEWEY